MAMTPAERHEFRAAICRTALPLFLERAIADVSLQAVADALGVSFWSVYRQYDTREALYRAAVEPLFLELETAVTRVRRVRPSVAATIAACMQQAADLMQTPQYRQAFILLMRDGASQPWLHALYLERIVGPLGRTIEQAVRRAGEEHGLVIGVEPGAGRKVLRQLESLIVMPRLLPGDEADLVGDDIARIRDAAAARLMAATYSVEFAEPAAA